MHSIIGGTFYDTEDSIKLYERGGETLWSTQTEETFLTSENGITRLYFDQDVDWIRQGFPHDTREVAKYRILMKCVDRGKFAKPWMDSVGLVSIPSKRARRDIAKLKSKKLLSQNGFIRHSSSFGDEYYCTDDLSNFPLVYQAIYDTALSFKIFAFCGETLWRLNEISASCFFVENCGVITPIDFNEAKAWVQKHFPHDEPSIASKRIYGKSREHPLIWADSHFLICGENGRVNPLWSNPALPKYDFATIREMFDGRRFSKSAEIHQGERIDPYDYLSTDEESDLIMIKMRFG